MRKILILVLAMIFGGCAMNSSTARTESAKSYDTIFRINTKCEPCSQKGYETTIDGRLYRSDIALNCCENSRTIDTSAALKKVYIHKVVDLADSQKSVKINGKNVKFDKNFASVFYAALTTELKSRGIYVENSSKSPYTYRVDFDFTDIRSAYSPGANYLNSKLSGTLNIKNINKKRTILITTTQSVSDLNASQSSDFDMFMNLLIKQSANKVAQEVSNF
ncbi:MULTISPECIES: hypothetical protein [Campylobacter]|uniref:hypothetical protein n=1 Tax=Campylobacter TaxID=194 RepID=UPI000A3347D9|nr:hypothetical protein [Campylobacter sp. P0124]MCR8695874.1 hypothetical protein [Campylobacter sp. RM19073]